MRKLALVVVAAALSAAPAFAQSEADVKKAAGEAAGKLNSNDARAGRVMNNIACVGSSELAEVVDFVREKMTIVMRTQAEPSSLNGLTITLSDKLPDTPRVQAAYVYYQAAGAMKASFPDSIEKEYMRISLATPAWMEMGAEGNKLPVIDVSNGYTEASMAAMLRSWYYGGVEELVARNNPKLASIKNGKDDKAKAQFEAFRKAESEWVMANSFRFQQ